MRAYPLIALLALPGMPLFAADAGTSSANFLKLGIGPRALAMGEAQVAVADDVYATYWNPAGLAQLEAKEAGFVHNEYVDGIKEEFAAYAHPMPGIGTMAGTFTYLGMDKFQGYDASGMPTSSVGASDSAATFSYARALIQERRLGSMLSVGLTGRWLRETLDTVSASAYAADAGVLFRPGRGTFGSLKGWGAGLAIRNLGTPLKFDQDAAPLPRTIVAGLSYQGQWLGQDLTLALDGEEPRDGRRSVSAGGEIWALKTFAARAGFTSRGDLGTGLRLGAGIRFKTLEFDYAFASAGDFGSAHRFGVTVRFQPRKPNREAEGQDWFEKGRVQFNRLRYPEALLDFNKALELDPSHPEALEWMRKTYEKLKEPNRQ